MNTTTRSSLRAVYRRLTRAEQAQLVAIAQGRNEAVMNPICETLLALGLLRMDGNKYVATEDGRFIAALC
jgi:hypothetical protein